MTEQSLTTPKVHGLNIERVVKWSACLPSASTIRVRIPLRTRVFFFKMLLKRTKINKKDHGFGPLKTHDLTHKVLSSFRVRVPNIKLLSDEHLYDGREDDVAEDEAKEGEDDAGHEEANATLAAAVHGVVAGSDAWTGSWVFFAKQCINIQKRGCVLKDVIQSSNSVEYLVVCSNLLMLECSKVLNIIFTY